MNCWKLTSVRKVESSSNLLENDNPVASISHVADIVLNILLEMEIPHNLLISDEGQSIYIIPRNFSKKEHEINSCWNDICGLVTLKDENSFNTKTSADIDNFFTNEIALSGEKLKEIYSQIYEKFSSIYEVTNL